MPSNTPLKINRQLHQEPAGFTNRVCLDGYESAYLGVAMERGVVSNLGCNCWNSKIHIVNAVIPSSTNARKSYIGHVALPRKKNRITFCLRSAAAPMRNELRERPATAYRT
jgi:hypothetical protein